MPMPITYIIIAATLLISIATFSNNELRDKLIFNPFRIAHDGEWYRFLSAGFIHADWLHLIVNMFVLYMFGMVVEQYLVLYSFKLPNVNFLLLYFVSLVLSSVSTYYKYKHTALYNSLGASGAVSGLLFAFVVFAPTQEICLYGILCLPGWAWLPIYIFYSTYMAKQGRDNINHDAHLWGGIVGALYVIVQQPTLITRWFN